MNFDEYSEFAQQMGNRESRGRAFQAFINQKHNGKTLLNLLFYSYFLDSLFKNYPCCIHHTAYAMHPHCILQPLFTNH